MHNQYTDLLLNLPEVKAEKVLEINVQTLHIEVTPIAKKQVCPLCQTFDFVIRKGSNPARKIRHGEALGKSFIYGFLQSDCFVSNAGVGSSDNIPLSIQGNATAMPLKSKPFVRQPQLQSNTGRSSCDAREYPSNEAPALVSRRKQKSSRTRVAGRCFGFKTRAGY
ncbi:hypothetical protein [Paenibacillus kribbensis]|uniref:hypothetical protein n=1 Tax=Paenibacillus kribbensis TaxID=172713 RepID=UPI002117E72F|nr:hypothetical protein [Paenibacillus kribbensis]